MSAADRFLRWFDREEETPRLGLFRIVVGFMLIRHTWSFVDKQIAGGYYAGKFHVPYWDWLVTPSESSYILLLGLMIACGVLIVIGIATRPALWIGAGAATLHLFLNQFWYRHNRYFVILSLVLLAVSASYRSFAADAWRCRPEERDRGALWPVIMLRIQMSIIYLASAFGKTIDPDWSSGRVLWHRATLGVDYSNATGLQGFLKSFEFAQFNTFVALFNEYFIGLGLWFPWTRRMAIWFGLILHGHIEVNYNVLTFSYLTIGTYFLWVRPTRWNRTLAYDPGLSRHRLAVAWIRALDWLSKIRLEPRAGTALVLTEPEGRRYRGLMALALGGCALPLTFPVAFPVSWLRLAGLGRVTDSTPADALVHDGERQGLDRALLLVPIVSVGILVFWAALAHAPGVLDHWRTRYLWAPCIALTLALVVAADRFRGRGESDSESVAPSGDEQYHESSRRASDL